MSLWRLKEGVPPLLWPDGSVRAMPGEVFERYEDSPVLRARVVADRLVAGRQGDMERAADGELPPKDRTMPASVLAVFREATAEVELHSEEPKPKAARPKRKASKVVEEG